MKNLKPYEIFDKCAGLTDDVIVGFSTGKDGLVILDVAKKKFRRVQAYYMYLVPGLRSIENYLRLIEHRYEIQILRVPHLAVSDLIRFNSWRFHSAPADKVPFMETGALKAYVRKTLGCEWVLTGEKMTDSLQRRGMIHAIGGLDPGTKNVYPVGHWSERHIWDYISLKRLPVCPTYAYHSIHSYEPHDIKAILNIFRRYPDDVERVCQYFPFLRAKVVQQLLALKQGATDFLSDEEESDEETTETV